MTANTPRIKFNDDRGPEVVRDVALVAALATVAVILRLVSRHIKKVRLRASDYTIVLALLSAWGNSIIVFKGMLTIMLQYSSHH